MQVLSLIWGIFAIIGFFVAFLPCLGSLNWLNIPFSGVGLILGIVAIVTNSGGENGKAIAGTIMCGIAVFIGALRLMMGGGVL